MIFTLGGNRGSLFFTIRNLLNRHTGRHTKIKTPKPKMTRLRVFLPRRW